MMARHTDAPGSAERPAPATQPAAWVGVLDRAERPYERDGTIRTLARTVPRLAAPGDLLFMWMLGGPGFTSVVRFAGGPFPVVSQQKAGQYVDLEVVQRIRPPIPYAMLKGDKTLASWGLVRRRMQNAVTAQPKSLTEQPEIWAAFRAMCLKHQPDLQKVLDHIDQSALRRPRIGGASDDVAAAEVNVCEQAQAHLQQARDNLNKASERSRKDAVRDAMSAMEVLYKKLGKAADIKRAYQALRSQGTWGPDEALKDGLTVWKHLHHVHPDVRHGQATATDLSEEEAYYWIGRMLNFINYMTRKHAGQDAGAESERA